MKDSTHLNDGTFLSKKGVESLRLFTDVPSSMVSYLEEFGYQDQLTNFLNDDLDRRHSDWTSNGKEPRNFRIRLREDEAGDEYVRAIVSERYGVIDNQDALEMIVERLCVGGLRFECWSETGHELGICWEFVETNVEHVFEPSS